MSKVRKAIAAGFGAVLTALFTGLATEVPRTQAGWLALLGASVGAGVIVGYGVWQTPNEVTPPSVARSPGVTTRNGPAPY